MILMNHRWERTNVTESSVTQPCRTVYLNAGHDIQTVQNIKISLLYMKGVKTSKVPVVEIDSLQNELKAQNGENISHYHSVEFQGSKIRFLNYYYSVGNSIYLDIKSVKFASGLEVITLFEKIGSSFITPSSSKKLRLE